jgi:predicted nucleic acid-binding protein
MLRSWGRRASVIFDTDVLIWYFRANSTAADFLENQTDRAVSIVTMMELYQGARTRDEARIIRRFFQENVFRIIPINEAISHLAVTMIEDHARSNGLQVADALIAATARETASTLATGNIKHFRSIPGLDLKAFNPRA